MAWLAGQCTQLLTFVWSKVETSLVDQESSALTISAPHCSILMSLCNSETVFDEQLITNNNVFAGWYPLEKPV